MHVICNAMPAGSDVMLKNYTGSKHNKVKSFLVPVLLCGDAFMCSGCL